MSQISRRLFLTAVPAGLAGWGWAAGKGAALAAGCRDAMFRELGKPDCWSACESVGAEAIEASVDDQLNLPMLVHPAKKYSVSSAEGMKQLDRDLKAARVKISAFCVFSRFDQRPEFEIDFGAKLARIAKQLGVRTIRIDVAAQKTPADKFLDSAVAALKKLIDASEGTGVSFGVENHSRTTNNPEFLLPLLERVGSKRLGVTLDTGNFYWFGHPLAKVYELIEAVAPHVVHTHCKNIQYPADQREVQRPMGWEYAKYNCPVDKGDLDFGRIIKILRAAKYTGDLCVEDEGLRKFPETERAGVLGREIAYLKKLRG